jgi:hypothetical protein
MQPLWGANSDRARDVQVPARASLVFTACAHAREQSVRILWDFSAYQMLYCAEMRASPAGVGRSTGNRLKWLS